MIIVNDPAHGPIIAKAAGCLLHPSDVTICRVNDRHELLGGSIFTNYTGKSITVHVASFARNWINRNLLFATFAYPFLQLGVTKLIGQVDSRNDKAVNFNNVMGFTLEATIKDVFPGGDMLIMSMYKDACRHIHIKPRNLEADVITYRS